MESIVGRHLVNSEYFPRTSPPPLILPVRVFSGCHNNPVQGISVCADEQSFLSADDLEVFWWNFESSATSKGSRIADLKPISGCMEDVSELITTAKFHPTHNSLFLLGRSSGLTAVGDLRESATGARRRYSMCMQVRPSTVCGPVLEEYGDILSSVSDADFVGSSHVVTRDYLSLQLWDTRQTSEPCAVAPLMPYLVPRLEALYDMDKIFDRFPVAVDHISGTVVTGLYDGAAAVWQPLQGGQCNTKDALTFYRPDPQLLLCEVENGSQVTYELLEASFAQRWEASTLSRVSRTGYPQALTPEPVDNKVMSVSISEGGRRFAMSLKDGRSVFLFER
uniref:Uncharacterized protein TCIL3000_11_15140 n=1 Tax=Trypanosoma congolense (strain IL3000) TaxID=1068625 RepID=G0V2X4_TRYCI|nr:unnamed protein product [Trypanosoma congolense IL3000]